jgi:hypothetical protein
MTPIAEINNEWNYTSTPPYVFMAWCLKYQRKLSLYYAVDNFEIGKEVEN